MNDVEQHLITKPKQNPFITVTPFSKILAMILFIALPFVGFYLGVRYQKFISIPQFLYVASNRSVLPVTSKDITVRIEPYTFVTEGDKNFVKFQVTNLNNNVPINNWVYWTDKKGPCERKFLPQPFSEFITVPMDEIDNYVFFRFYNDIEKTESQIYASSPWPIFQCGKLAE